MNSTDPERRPDIFEPLTVPELLHNRLMDIFNAAEANDASILDDSSEPESGDLTLWLHVTGRQEEDEIMALSSDNQLCYITADIFRMDEYHDASALGLDADGEPSQIMLMDNMAELSRREIKVRYKVKDYPGTMTVEEGYFADYENGWRVSYEIEAGWTIGFWKGGEPQVERKAENWTIPTPQDIDTLRLILEKAEIATSMSA